MEILGFVFIGWVCVGFMLAVPASMDDEATLRKVLAWFLFWPFLILLLAGHGAVQVLDEWVDD